MIDEIGYVFVYISAFGFSELIVEHFKLEGLQYFLYNSFLLIVGLVTIFYYQKKNNEQKVDTLLE